MKTPSTASLAAAVLLAGAAHAQIINGSFEIADPSAPDDGWISSALGWSNPLGEEYSGWRAPAWFGGITPTHGSYMAVCAAGTWLDQEGVWLNAGDRVVFEYAVVNPEDSYQPAIAYASLIGVDRVNFFSPLVPIGGIMPWTTGEIVAPLSGVYTLRIGGEGYGYWAAASFDNFRVVPAPASAAVIACGGLLTLRRRR
jgi:hypothetical protein